MYVHRILRKTETRVAPVEDASRDFYFIFSERAVWGVGGGVLPEFFLLLSFPCSANHEWDWPPCKVVFSGWQPIR